MHVVNQPAIPFWGHVPEGVHPGTVIHVDGHVPHHSDRFEINLVSGHDIGHHSNIALHVNPRIHEEYLILNSRRHHNWENEDRHKHIHSFHRGSNFSITIHVESEYYRISVNGSHLCNFHHRMPYHEVGMLWIDGCVDVHRIEYRREYESSYVQTAYVPTNTFVPGAYIDGGGHHDHHHHHHHHH